MPPRSIGGPNMRFPWHAGHETEDVGLATMPWTAAASVEMKRSVVMCRRSVRRRLSPLLLSKEMPDCATRRSARDRRSRWNRSAPLSESSSGIDAIQTCNLVVPPAPLAVALAIRPGPLDGTWANPSLPISAWPWPGCRRSTPRIHAHSTHMRLPAVPDRD